MSKRIGYPLFEFPIGNMTYVVNEVADLLGMSTSVEILSFDRPSHPPQQKAFYAYDLDRITTYVPLNKQPNGQPKNPLWDFGEAVQGFFELKGVAIRARLTLLRSCFDGQLGKVLSLRRFVACAAMYKWICEKKIDIAYIHLGNNAAYLLPVRKIVDTPIVTFFHGMDFTSYVRAGGNYTELFSIGELFFVGSEYAKESLLKLGCPHSKLCVLGIGVDSHNISFKKRAKGEIVRLLSVGRLAEKKGFEYAIRAVAQVRKRHRNITYTIVGEGPLRSTLESLIAELGLESCIRLTGFLSQEKVILEMQAHDVFVLSSVTAKSGDTESLGVVLLEAQLTGMPVVATRHNGFPEAVLADQSGFLVPERDVDRLAGRINYLIENPSRWETMGAAGRRFVIEKYDKVKVRHKLLEKINTL